ncbi:multidrug efflux protein [Halolamina pelagica]|uniref:Multidrug-efflux transporter n=2 Tax=Halolamina pelagica TaxID=699431 RepID=A0A0P7HYZ5_9EURY|nr:MATE family efflux transporter [Halolamina pelagica]KPN29558.1 multidrug efflux protein [Halolamina pelagica]
MSGNDSRVDMTTGAITPKLFALSWPLVLGNLVQTLYNLADMFWVGRVNAEAVAAVSLMFPTSWMFVSVAMGITAAAVALVSQYVGAGEQRQADHAVGQTVLLTVAVGLLLATIGFLIRYPLVSLIGAQGQVFTYSMDYLEPILAAIPFTFLFFAFRAVLRAAGDVRTAMWLVVISAGVNVILDPFLILGWTLVEGAPIVGTITFPAMGVRGAGIATMISRVLAALIGLLVLLDGRWGVRLRIPDLRPDREVLTELVRIGAPGTGDGLARSFAAVFFAALVARFGPIATAAYGIGIRLMSVSWTVSGAVGQATATGVGQNLGADTPDRAAEVAWKATAATMAFLFAAGALVYAYPATAVGIFVDEQPVIDAGVVLLRIIAPFWAFLGGLMVIQGGFRGAGQTAQAMALSLASRWLFRVPVAALLAYYLAWDENGLWWAMAFSGVITFVIGAAWFNLGNWREGVVDTEPSVDVDESADAEAVAGED